MKHGGLVGTFDRKIGKKAQDIEPKKRSLALRAIAGDRESDSAGVVCWTLTWKPKKTKVQIFLRGPTYPTDILLVAFYGTKIYPSSLSQQVSRLCVAWDVGNGKKGGANVRGIAISLGDYAPSFDDMWLTQEKFLEKEKHKLYVNNILKPNTQDTRFIGLQRTNQLENTLYLDQPKVQKYFYL